MHAHDPEEMCRLGDKVIIRSCNKVSQIKNYYVRDILYMIPRYNFAMSKFLKYEKRALAYNQDLQENHIIRFKDFLREENI